jgi:hypothetical protein
MLTRGKRLDNGEFIEGDILKLGDSRFIVEGTPSPVLKYGGDYHLDCLVHKIDSSTIEYKVDDIWMSIEEIEQLEIKVSKYEKLLDVAKDIVSIDKKILQLTDESFVKNLISIGTSEDEAKGMLKAIKDIKV